MQHISLLAGALQ